MRHRCAAENLLVLLPGAGMQPEHYVENGFFAAVDHHASKLGLLAVDLELDALSSGKAIPAIVDQILRPARADYASLWLGGLLALSLNADFPGLADGLCLLAPYPGSRLTTNAIERAGGLDSWQPTAEEMSDPEYRAYNWLKAPPTDFPVYLGYGEADRFAEGMDFIAARFPAAARQVVPGGHDWPAWLLLWEHFLALAHFSI